MKRLILIITVFLITGIVMPISSAQADVPHLINYQGRLTDAADQPLTGSHSITFRIYDAEGGGNLLWGETHSSVTVTDGIFEVMLGGVTALDLSFDKQYYLGIQVGNDPEMTPRQKIASVGYAYKAEKAGNANNADTVDGIHASTIPMPNELIALNSNGKLSLSTMPFKAYDSGWFAVSDNRSYTKEHNLGTIKVVWQLLFATDSNGSNCQVVTIPQEQGSHIRGGYLHLITASHITARTGRTHVARTYGAGLVLYPSGYYRIIGIALE